MNRIELKKRWIMGTVQPELFYIPWENRKSTSQPLYIRIVDKTTGELIDVDYIRIQVESLYFLVDQQFSSEQAREQYINDPDKDTIGRYLTNYYAPGSWMSDYQTYSNGYWSFESDTRFKTGDEFRQYMVANNDINFETNPPIIEESTLLSEDRRVARFSISPRSIIRIDNLPKGIYTIELGIQNISSWCDGNFYYQKGLCDDPNTEGLYYDRNYYYPWLEKDENGVYKGALTHDWGDPAHAGEKRYDTAYSRVNIDSNGYGSYFYYKSISWIDYRYIDLSEGKAVSSSNIDFYEISRKFPDNTLVIETNEYTFDCRIFVYVEGYSRRTGLYITDYESAMGEKYYTQPGNFDYYKYEWGEAGYFFFGDKIIYLLGCKFEVEYEDGTTAEFDVGAQSVSYNDSAYCTIQLKKGRNTIRCSSPPALSNYCVRKSNSRLYITSPQQTAFKYDNDTHTETVTITINDADAKRAGTYIEPTFNYYFPCPHYFEIKIVKKGLPLGVQVVGTYDAGHDYYVDTNGNISYAYSNAIEFYYNGQYYGYLQAGFAPCGLGLNEYYGSNHIFDNSGNNAIDHILINTLYLSSMSDCPFDLTSETWNYSSTLVGAGWEKYISTSGDYCAIQDMTLAGRNVITAQYQLGKVYNDDELFNYGGRVGYASPFGHITNTVKSGDIVLLSALDAQVYYDHINHGTPTPWRCDLGIDTYNKWAYQCMSYLNDNNCLNDTNGQISTNIYSQQYYYLGDGLTKQQANEFIGVIAFNPRYVHEINML